MCFFAFIFSLLLMWLFAVRFAYSNFELMPDNKRTRISFATEDRNGNDARRGTCYFTFLSLSHRSNAMSTSSELSAVILHFSMAHFVVFRKAMSKYCDAALLLFPLLFLWPKLHWKKRNETKAGWSKSKGRKPLKNGEKNNRYRWIRHSFQCYKMLEVQHFVIA